MRRDGLVMAVALIALLALATPVTALTVAINPSGDISGTLDSRNITIAFNQAGSGGSVILNPGTYYMGGVIVPGTVTGITIAANTTCGGNPSNTIISGTGTNGIFTYLSTRGTFIIDNLTFRNGRTLFLGGAINAPIGTPTVYVTSSTFNDCSASNFINGEGGAIYAHGPVRVISSAFTNCSASGYLFGGGGGAIWGWDAITISSSTFSNCSAVGFGSHGGAITDPNDEYHKAGPIMVSSSTFTSCFSGQNGGAINGGEAVTVTTSTFSNCSTLISGGAIDGYAVTVTSSTFTNCSVSGGIFGGGGGAIVGGRGITLLYSRLYDNAAPRGADIYFYGSGSLIAPDNWWGTNTPAFSSRISGAPGPSSWLVLGIAATPASVNSARTALVTANLSYVNTSGYYSPASLNVPEGIPVVFTLPSGSGRVLPGAGTISANANSTLFIPTPSTGTAIVNATVDGQTVSVAIPVT